MSGALAALLLAVLVAMPAAAQPALPRGTVVVLPFENPSGDPRLPWMREALALLLGDVLSAHGVAVIERDERVVAFDRLQLPVAAVLSRASAIRVGQALGAAAVVVGRVEPETGGLILTAQVVHLDEGRLAPPVVVRGPTPGVLDTVARLGAALAGGRIDVAWSAPPSLAAFESYSKGLTAETPDAARAALDEAIRIAPDYDAARLALWQVHSDQGAHAAALAHARAVAGASSLAREARFLAGISLTRLRRLDEAFDVLQALQKERPLPEVANALGVVQLRRGGSPQTGEPTYYFNLATELAPGEADFFFNLGYAYWLARDANGAAYWLREAVRRNPADGEAHFVLAAALRQMGATAEAARERELAGRLSETYAPRAGRGGTETVPRGLERLRDRLGAAVARVETRLVASGQRDQAALATFHLDAARRAFERHADREALDEARRALYLSPYLAEAHLLTGHLHQRAGRLAEAVQAYKIAVWSEESVPALVALAEACLEIPDLAAARAAVERALAIDPKAAAALALRSRLAQRR